jgi:hypothetical protein
MRVGMAIFIWSVMVGSAIETHDPIATKVTWTGDIARIFQARCVSCHRAGSVNPMPLTTYEEVRPWASAIRQQVLSRKMPIWHAARGFGEFANDPSLSPFHIALIAAWANAGGPRGSDREAASVPNAIVPLSDVTARIANTRERSLACGTEPLAGRLLAVKPQLEPGASVTITAVLPDGRHEIIVWIRDYDPRYPTTYWLRTPLTLTRGSRLEMAATSPCRIVATVAR